MRNKKVLILGGALLQSYIIKKAKALEYEVHVLDMNSEAIGFKHADKYSRINIVDKDACLQYAIENNIDGVLTAATDYGVLTASYIAENMGLNGLKYEVAKTIKNKYEIRKKLSKENIDDINQFYEIDDKKKLSNIENEIVFPVIVKPCDGSGSKAINRADCIEELEKSIDLAINTSLSGKAFIETFIDGEEYGVESFVYNDNIYVLGIMKKDMTLPPYYAELGHSIPSGLSIEMENKIKQTVISATKTLGVNFGAINMDLLVNKYGKVCIVDIGARMGGNLIGSHIIPMSTGIDYMGNIIKATLNEEVDFDKKENKCVSTRILSLTPGKVKSLPDFSKYYDNEIKYIVCNLKKGDLINEYHNNLDGCGYVVACSSRNNNLKYKVIDIKNKIDKSIIRE